MHRYAVGAVTLQIGASARRFFGMPKTRRRVTSRWLTAATTAFAVTALTGCSPAAQPPADDRPFVLTTFTVLADIAQNVAGEHLRVESITKVGAEVHGYEPTPSDIIAASRADLVLENGLNLEAWFERFIDSANVPHVVVSEGIDVIDITGDSFAGTPNPHAWMSPLTVQHYAVVMATAFSELSPEHTESFVANASAYSAELQLVHQELTDAVAALEPARRALVTCEGAFSYLAHDAGLTEHYLWPVNAEQQATPRQIASVIEFVRDNDVPAVFCESTVSDSAMQQVVDATDAVFGGTLYVDSLSAPDGPVPTYLDLIRYDTALIIAGLTGRSP